MNHFAPGPTLALFMSLALGNVGCVYEEHHHHRDSAPYSPAATAEAPPSDGALGGGVAPPSTPAPMLVEVDTDQTMTAVGGDGVGVFIEYGKGGHWHLFWTCDTNQSRQDCDFSISAAADSGEITNIDATELSGGFLTSPTTARVDMTSKTSTEMHGVRFDTSPGTVITVEAAVGGIKDGAFLFFVQDGKVNGGFTGQLTNPLKLQGNAP